MGKALSRLGGEKAKGFHISDLYSKAWWQHGTTRSEQLQQLHDKNAQVLQLKNRLSDLDSRLKVRDDQVSNLTKELERQNHQRELLVSQLDKSAEERTSFELRLKETRNILQEIELLKEQVSQYQVPSPVEVTVVPQNSCKIGVLGEEWVLNCLQNAFPSNSSISRTNTNHSGDILFRPENTDIMIMFEVKDHASGTVIGKEKGGQIIKFFDDLRTSPVDGGVLISLNGPVDPASLPLTPMWEDSKPYLYVDSLRTQYPDPECILKVVVQMMVFLIRCQEDGNEEGFHVKLENYLQTVKILQQTYQKLYKNHEAERKNLEHMKATIDVLLKTLLKDINTITTKHETEGIESKQKVLPQRFLI